MQMEQSSSSRSQFISSPHHKFNSKITPVSFQNRKKNKNTHFHLTSVSFIIFVDHQTKFFPVLSIKMENLKANDLQLMLQRSLNWWMEQFFGSCSYILLQYTAT